MAEKTKENKVVLEREYVVPLRRKFMRTPQYKRTPKAVKALKEFIARHMKVEERDFDKVKIDKYLNLEFWMGGIRKPPIKIKVKAKKFENGEVRVELAEIPDKIKWMMEKEKKLLLQESGKPGEKKEIEKEEKTEEEKKVVEEKKESVVEAGLKQQEKAHTEMKHTKSMEKGKPKIRRMALQK